MPLAGKTLLLTAALAIAGTFAAYLTEWMLLIPLFFSLGIPLLNIRQPGSGKIRLILWILLGTVVIFTLAVILMLNIDYSRQILQAVVVGIAGCFILLLNGMLIPDLQLSLKAFVFTFLLSSISVPFGIWITEKIPTNDISLIGDFFGQYGIMILWMVMTAAGIVYGTGRK